MRKTFPPHAVTTKSPLDICVTHLHGPERNVLNYWRTNINDWMHPYSHCFVGIPRIRCMVRTFVLFCHYNDGIMSAITSQITSLAIVYSSVYSGADQRKHQSSASLAFVRGIHRWPVNSPHKGPVTRKMSPFDDVIMCLCFVVYGCMSILPIPIRINSLSPGPLFTKRTDVLPQDLAKSRSHEIGV